MKINQNIIVAAAFLLVFIVMLVPVQSQTFEHVFTEKPKTRYSIIKGEKSGYDFFQKKTCPINASCAGGEITLKLYIL